MPWHLESISLACSYTSGMQASSRARCFLNLNEPEPALALTRQSQAGIDPAFVREMAFTHVKAARAHLQMTDIDAACAELTDAVTLTAGNSSARLSGAITGARRSLAPWQGSKPVAALDEHLRELTA